MSESGAPANTLRPSSFRQVMSRFATGVVVLTVGGEHVHGMTANSFTSVSLRPPLVLCCVAHSAAMHGALVAERRFGVSVLAADQQHLARYFADRTRPRGSAQFEPTDWWPGPRTGAPLLSNSLAWLECELTDAHRAGDHSVFVGAVLSTVRGADRDGLLFLDGAFRRVER
ncbi:flavin reductase family protein [Actinosynnema sp. NPDC020468]|uniref:flavin reductase family protein n=1 Tax=Actinosynnema sp. NPDC020468 TaxID=3154488 RepID=UPI0033E62B16